MARLPPHHGGRGGRRVQVHHEWEDVRESRSSGFDGGCPTPYDWLARALHESVLPVARDVRRAPGWTGGGTGRPSAG